MDFYSSITRERFEEINRDLFDKTMISVKQVLNDSKFKAEEIHDIVLIGGSTRIPRIQQLLKKVVGDKKFIKNINPDEAVAYGKLKDCDAFNVLIICTLIFDFLGAAIESAILSGTKSDKMNIIEITPLALGVGIKGGLMSVIAERNTQIPFEESSSYTTCVDNQTVIRFDVYEGERPLIKDNRLLGEFLLTDIPPAPKGVPSIKVSFNMDENGILKVSAVDKLTENKKEIEIDYGKGQLSNTEIRRLVDESKERLENDKIEKERIIARNKLDDYCYKLNRILTQSELNAKLQNDERNKLQDSVDKSLTWLKNHSSANKAQFDDKLSELQKIFNPLFKKLYND
jgi:L1 cell adhesion molecule like protein